MHVDKELKPRLGPATEHLELVGRVRAAARARNAATAAMLAGLIIVMMATTTTGLITAFIVTVGFGTLAALQQIALREARDKCQKIESSRAQDQASGLVPKGVFVDPKTKLMWTKKDNGLHVNWFSASEYAEHLRLGGYEDWRLPTVEELESLYDPKTPGEFKVKTPVQLTNRFVWGVKQEGTGSASSFDFGYGMRRLTYLDDSYLRVLCVRGKGRQD
jgi:Protein of unknown function (DUF1566)